MDLSYNMKSRSKRSEPVPQNHDAIVKWLTYAFLVEDEDDKLNIETFTRRRRFPHRPRDIFLEVLYGCIIISKDRARWVDSHGLVMDSRM